MNEAQGVWQQFGLMGGAVFLAITLANIIKSLVDRRANGKGYGNGQNLQSALDHKSLGEAMERLGKTMERHTEVLTNMAVEVHEMHEWHDHDNPSEPGRKIWWSPQSGAEAAFKNIRLLCRKMGVEPAED